MALILDTGILYAYYDRRDHWHRAASELIRQEPGELIIPAPTIPEVDHLVGARLGQSARAVFYRGLVEGSYFIADLPREGYARVMELNDRFANLKLGFVDAAVLVVSEMLDLKRIATTDRRDFEAVQAAFGLQLLP